MKKELALTALALSVLTSSAAINAEEPRLNLDALKLSPSGVASVNDKVVPPAKLTTPIDPGKAAHNGLCGNIRCGANLKNPKDILVKPVKPLQKLTPKAN